MTGGGAGAAPIEVLRTYLEMTSPADLVPARSADPALRVEPLAFCPASFYRYLYATVGEAWRWIDRLGWSDARLRQHLDRPTVEVDLFSVGGAPAGYFELESHDDGSVEIAYFGLLPGFLGRGYGKHLLTVAVERAFSKGARRVWLHTCSLDHPVAIPNYEARGFRRFRQETYLFPVPV